jgi:hypothetical protein
MEAKNSIALVREKLDLYGKPYIDAVFLQKILDKFAPNYTIKQLCNLDIVRPIKRSRWYLNRKSRGFVNPFVVGGLYMGDETYAFGGMSVYNRYSLSEQIAEIYTVYNTKISGDREIAGIRYSFIRQRQNFFYGIRTEKADEYEYRIMSPERAFIQMLREGKTFPIIPKNVQKEKLLRLAEKYASKPLQSRVNSLCI